MQLTVAFLFAFSVGAIAVAPPSYYTPPSYGTPAKPSCTYSVCIKASDIPPRYRPEASAFCSFILRSSLKPVTSTTTVTTTTTTTSVPSASTTVTTTTTTTTATRGTICTGFTIIAPASTYVAYPTGDYGATARKRAIEERQTIIPDFVSRGCRGAIPVLSKLKSACSCLVKPTTRYTTSTITSTTTATASVATVTQTSTSVVTQTISPCTSTVTATSTKLRACGTPYSVPASASKSGSITCPSTVPSPSLNALHRIEGNDTEGTIFEGCIESGPRYITTSSGGTHLCDGTNDGANASPGTTITDQADAAVDLLGTTLDGSYYDQNEEFFISRISNTQQTGNQYWGVLRNNVFTQRGGCQEVVVQNDRSLWLFDAFRTNLVLLTLSPDWAAAEAGKGSVTVTVNGVNPNNGASSPYAGASIAGQTSNASGQATIRIPSTPGCYQYKATSSNSGRSNAFYLSVYDKFVSN